MRQFFKKNYVVICVVFVFFMLFLCSAKTWLDILYFVAMMFGLYLFKKSDD